MNPKFDQILKELSETLPYINDKEYTSLLDAMLNHRRIIVVGVGRVMISLKAWVKRLKHLGLDINYFGSETEGVVKENDLVVIASSSGESFVPVNVAQIAKYAGCTVFYIGCTPQSSAATLSNYHLILKGKTKFKSENEYQSKQPMSTLYEQQLYILGDSLALDIMKIKNLTEETVKQQHANLE